MNAKRPVFPILIEGNRIISVASNSRFKYPFWDSLLDAVVFHCPLEALYVAKC